MNSDEYYFGGVPLSEIAYFDYVDEEHVRGWEVTMALKGNMGEETIAYAESMETADSIRECLNALLQRLREEKEAIK